MKGSPHQPVACNFIQLIKWGILLFYVIVYLFFILLFFLNLSIRPWDHHMTNVTIRIIKVLSAPWAANLTRHIVLRGRLLRGRLLSQNQSNPVCVFRATNSGLCDAALLLVSLRRLIEDLPTRLRLLYGYIIFHQDIIWLFWIYLCWKYRFLKVKHAF